MSENNKPTLLPGLVNQHDDKSCGRACVAMITGIPYEDLSFEKTGREYYTVKDIKVELDQRGVFNLVTAGIGWFTSLDYLLQVPSLNTQGGMHWVYLKKGVIYDPQNGVPGKMYYDNDNYPHSSGVCILLTQKYSKGIIELMESATGLTTIK